MSNVPPGARGRECDVVVVGGGPVGLFLATLLAQQGVDVVVLERRTGSSAHSRAIGLHPPGLVALQRLGLDEEILAQGVPVERGVGRSRGHQLGELAFDGVRPDFPFVLSLPQHRTEAVLVRRLGELAPGALRRGWDVHDVQDAGGRVDVVAARSPAPGPDSAPGPAERAVWRARVLVAADGARSVVRARSGIGTDLKPYPDTFLMGDFADTTGDGSTAAIYLEPGGVVESFPLPGGMRRWVAHTGAVPAASRAEDLASIVADRTGEVLDPGSHTMTSAFTVRRQLARRLVTGHQVLIGDAAHEFSPIGGQGITLGWLDALALAPLLEDLVADDPGCPLPAIPSFQDFQRARLRSARRAARVAELNMVMGRPVSVVAGRARGIAVRGALRTPLRHTLARAFTMAWV
ncbi:FAD-dependent oxidoreductase [Kocuria sabuli]|uniref:FAD-dependent oxidoreductase n=1 Tax=Kocuria sabuli TaxID=3071448 RepID=UPI0034D3F68D